MEGLDALAELAAFLQDRGQPLGVAHRAGRRAFGLDADRVVGVQLALRLLVLAGAAQFDQSLGYGFGIHGVPSAWGEPRSYARVLTASWQQAESVESTDSVPPAPVARPFTC